MTLITNTGVTYFEHHLGSFMGKAIMLTRRQFLHGAAGGVALLALGGTSGCSANGGNNQVIVYSCLEGERNEALLTELTRDLPNIDVRLKYVSTGNLAARLKVEGESAECDLVLGVEGGYLMAAQDSLETLTEHFDLGVFEDDLVISNKIMPQTRECGCFAYNTEVLAKDGIEPPTSLDDLLDERFQGKVCMPNPKASSTGYNFYYSMVNLLGEDGALAYFDELAKNVYQFTSSGSAPASALTRGEAGVGLSLVFQLVSEKNSGSPIELALFPEGAPWTMNGNAVVKNHGNKQAVWDVMNWLYTKGILLDKELFVPDKVFKNQETHVDGYPTNITYANMTGLFDIEEKERLLEAWKY